jgi:type III secretion protein V
VGDAVDRYTILTVGDGMVSQIPSLFVSIAAGVLITRVGSADGLAGHLGGEIGTQVRSQPMALLITGGVLFGFVLVPGFPKPQFFILAMLVGGIGWVLLRAAKDHATLERTPVPGMRRDGAASAVPKLIDESVSPMTVPLQIKIAPGLRERLDPPSFDAELGGLRKRLSLDLGLPFPGLSMAYDAQLVPSAFVIFVQEVRVFEGLLDDEPAGARLESVLAEHLESAIRAHADWFIGMPEVQGLIAGVETTYPELAAEILRALPLQRVTDVLRRLVGEGVSIRNLREIFESLIVWGPKEKDVVMLTEYVRVDLGRYITQRHARGGEPLSVIMLDPRLEAAIRQSIQQTSAGSFLAFPPEQTRRVVDQLNTLLAAHAAAGALLLASMDIRRYVKKLLEGALPALPVLSFQEVGTHRPLQSIGRVQP